MSQSDYEVEDQTGASFLGDINSILAAIVTNNSGPTEPATTFAHQWWGDTTSNILKRRNAANTAWVNMIGLTQSLTNVNNTSDANKPVSTATQTALDAKLDATLVSQDAAEAGEDTAGRTWSALRVKQAIVANKAKLLHIEDQRPNGTDGGTFSSGSYIRRTLNTVVLNEISGSSLSGNQITLPSGKYYIEASCSAFAVSRHKAKLVNMTDSEDILIGSNSFSSTTTASITNSLICGQFELDAEKTIEIQHRSQSSRSSDGYGPASSFGDAEVYLQALIWRI